MRVVGYVRLSRDEDRESYSSILSQKSIIEDCARQNNWTIYKYYEDDNYSGYSFDRPGFNELIKDLDNNSIDVIIAKDLSRIGRHNAYTLIFVDKIKQMSKRLILPKEGGGYDTAGDENDLLGITTWYNEMYIKDISRKIRSSIRAKQKEGRMIIKESFGYKRSQSDKHKLEIDLEAASIVQKVFELYLAGIGYRKIAETLNNEGYPTPSQYHVLNSEMLSIKYKTAEQWNSVHVQRILKNDIYIGILRLAKTEKKTIKGKSNKQSQDKQYIFEDNHPAIISKETFFEVQNILQNRKTTHSKGAASINNIFSGIIYCQDCGSYMIAYKKRDKSNSYICGSYHKYGNKVCKRHTIQEDTLLKLVKEVIIAISAELAEDLGKIRLKKAVDRSEEKKQLKNILQKDKQICKGQLKSLILKKITDLKKENSIQYQNIINSSFDELENELMKRLAYLEKRIGEVEQELRIMEAARQNQVIQLSAMSVNSIQIEKKHIGILIDKILIDSLGNPTIYLKADIQALCYHIREDANLVPDL